MTVDYSCPAWTAEMLESLSRSAANFNLAFSPVDCTEQYAGQWELSSEEGICIWGTEVTTYFISNKLPTNPKKTYTYGVGLVHYDAGDRHTPPDSEVIYPEDEELSWNDAELRILHHLVDQAMEYAWVAMYDQHLAEEEAKLDAMLDEAEEQMAIAYEAGDYGHPGITQPEDGIPELGLDGHDIYRDQKEAQQRRVMRNA